jgi:hypothetical protein
MVIRILRASTLLAVLIAACAAAGALADVVSVRGDAVAGSARGGVLSGHWSGYIARSGASRQKIVIEINARETGGTWQLGSRCYGTLTLQSISGGYHHYLRHVASAATCAGGDVDCLMPDAGAVYDSVTSHIGGAYDQSGKLKRIRA